MNMISVPLGPATLSRVWTAPSMPVRLKSTAFQPKSQIGGCMASHGKRSRVVLSVLRHFLDHRRWDDNRGSGTLIALPAAAFWGQ